MPQGRWPANLTLEHGARCELIGTKRVRGTNVPTKSGGKFCHGGGKKDGRAAIHYGDEGGLETVDAWRCAPGCPVAALDAQSGATGAHGRAGGERQTIRFEGGDGGRPAPAIAMDAKGGASRFFFCAKASSSERGEENDHPTVKPIALMRYLVRLITPRGGLVLDPFAGSGTTGIAAVLEGAKFIGIEREERYAAIARRRIAEACGPLFGRTA